jgi:hypothetical protein
MCTPNGLRGGWPYKRITHMQSNSILLHSVCIYAVDTHPSNFVSWPMLSLGYSYDFKLFRRFPFRIYILSGVRSRIQLERGLSSFPFHWMNLLVFISSHFGFVDLDFWFPWLLTLLSESRLDSVCHGSHATGFHRWGEGWGVPEPCPPASTHMISI